MCVQVVLSLSPKGQPPPSAAEQDVHERTVHTDKDRKLPTPYVSTHTALSHAES